jgi:hypothetical protein
LDEGLDWALKNIAIDGMISTSFSALSVRLGLFAGISASSLVVRLLFHEKELLFIVLSVKQLRRERRRDCALKGKFGSAAKLPLRARSKSRERGGEGKGLVTLSALREE